MEQLLFIENSLYKFEILNDFKQKGVNSYERCQGKTCSRIKIFRSRLEYVLMICEIQSVNHLLRGVSYKVN